MLEMGGFAEYSRHNERENKNLTSSSHISCLTFMKQLKRRLDLF